VRLEEGEEEGREEEGEEEVMKLARLEGRCKVGPMEIARPEEFAIGEGVGTYGLYGWPHMP
jgi:hypothetical protein